MPFDPSQEFTVVEEAPAAAGFDPTREFTVVEEPPTVSGSTYVPAPGERAKTVTGEVPAVPSMVPSTKERLDQAAATPQEQQLQKTLETPLVNLPPETYAAPTLTAVDPQMATGIAGAVKRNVEEMTSPAGLATLPYMAVGGIEAAALKGGAMAARAVGTAFGLQGAEGLADASKRYLDAVKKGDKQGAADAWVDLAASSAMIFGGIESVKSVKAAVSEAPKPDVPPLLPRSQAELERTPNAQTKVETPSEIPAVEREPVIEQPKGQAEIGTPQRSGEGGNEQPNASGTPQAPLRDIATETPAEPTEPTSTPTSGGEEVRPKAAAAQTEAAGQVEPAASTEPASPEIIGMGGAVPTEFAPVHNRVTGIKNAAVDQQRAERGLPPVMKPLRESWGEAWDSAMAKMDADPTTPTHLGVQDRVIRDLKNNPRAATAEENVMLTQRMADFRNELDRARREERQAYDDGRIEDAQAASARADEWSAALADLEQITELAGTWAGRALAARKIMLNEDFTLAKMELDLRSKQGMKPLSQGEKDNIANIHNRIQDLEAKLKKTEQDLAQANAARVLAEMKVNPDGTAPIPEHIMRIVNRVGEVLDKRADAARARLRGKLFSLSPDVLKDLAEIGAANIYHIGLDFAKWSAKMVDDIGEKVRPHLQQVFQAAQKVMDDTATELAGGAPRQKRQVTATVLDPEQRRLKQWKQRTVRLLREYEEKIARGDFERKKRTEVKLDKEAEDLRFQLDQVKKQWYGKVFEKQLENESAAQKALRRTGEVSNTIRGWMTSADLSAVLRQGKFAVLQHPILGLKSIVPMLKAFASERGAYNVEQQIARKMPRYKRAGLAISETGSTLAKMEEAYMGRWLTKVPLVAGSARAYVTFLNKLRADVFDALVNKLGRNGETTLEQEKLIANAVNVFTGRGTIGMAEQAAAGLNTFFFAPKFVASRFQALLGQPLYYGILSGKVPFKGKGALKARALVAGEYGKLLAGYALIYSLAHQAGFQIGSDPKSSDFGKIIIGKTRLDPLAGLSQITVLLSRLATGQKTTQSGKVVPIRGKVPYGGDTSADIIFRFLRQKLAPVPGFTFDVLSGKDITGQEVTPETLAKRVLVPISFQDTLDTLEDQGVPKATALTILSIFGENVQTYETRKPAK